MSTRIGRRELLLAAGGLATAAAVGGCGVGGSPGGGGSPTGSLRATWWGGDSENAGINGALDHWVEEHGGEVLRESLPWDGYWDKLATQTAARNAPDLVMQAGSQIPDYADREALVDLNTVATLDQTVVDEGLRTFGAVEDRVYGVVAASNAMGLVVNTALAEKAGLSLPEAPYTWDDLGELAERTSHDLGDELWGLADAGGDLISLIMAVRGSGREFYNDDGTLNATTDDVATWLQRWDDLRGSGAVPPADVTSEGSGSLALSPMAKQKVALQFGWTQDFTSLTGIVKDDLEVVLPPYNTENPSLWLNAASLWSVSTSSSQADAVGELINFLLTDEQAVRAIGMSLGLPPTETARELLKPDAAEADQAAVDYMELVVDNSRPLNRLWPGGFASLRTKLNDLNEAVAFKDMTVEEAVEDFMAEADSGS